MEMRGEHNHENPLTKSNHLKDDQSLVHKQESIMDDNDSLADGKDVIKCDYCFFFQRYL